MGNNVAGGLGGAYQPGKQLDLRNSHWQMYEATKRDDKGGSSEVTIFKFLKTQTDRAAAAQRGMQKLRTMKHPYVLGFVDSNAEDKESLLLVTEACVPLSVWLEDTLKEGRGRSNSGSSNNSKINNDNSSEGPSLLNQALWGFRCVVNALDFLHTKCSIGHNSLSANSIFVVRNGDWKIGCLDFAANPSSERLFLRDSTGFIPRECIPPEVQSGGWGDAFKDADVYSLGRVLTTVLESIGDSGGGKVSDALRRSIQRMVSPDPEKRPNSTQILKYPDFNSESIKILADLDDFSLKTPQEVLDVLRKVAGKSKEFPRQICANKITPIVIDRLKIASIDFQNREMREYCRNSIDVCVEILALFVEGEKINEATLSPQASDILSQVWTMPDRTVRTCLLRTCKNMIVLFPAPVVNKSLFQPVLAGFSDSNPKMREETLKNLVHFVEKLDETNLQERLVRQIKLLQDDNEKSIRTNAVIFLSRIAPKLTAVTRSKVLSPCLVKAMRDGFVPCRSAGLKATQACAQLMDPMQLITTVLPQVCLLMVDPSGDVRTLALALMESTLKVVHGLHTAMNEQEMKARDMMMQSRSGGHGNMSGGGGFMGGDDSPNSPALKAQQQGTAASWGSWAVGEITKTIEKVAISETTNPNYNSNDLKSHIGELKNSFSSPAISSSSSSSATSSDSGGSNIGGMNIPARGNSNSNTNIIKPAAGHLSMAKSSSVDSGMASSSSSRATQEPKPKAKPLSLDNDDDDDNDGFDDFGTGKGSTSSISNSGKGASPSGWEKDDDINWSDDDADGDKCRDKNGSGKDRFSNSDSDRDGGSDDDDSRGYSKPSPPQLKMPAQQSLKVLQAASSWNDEEEMMAGASSSAIKPTGRPASSSSILSSSSSSTGLGLGLGLKTQGASLATMPVAPPAKAMLGGHISAPSLPQASSSLSSSSSSSSSSTTSTAFYFKNDSASSSMSSSTSSLSAAVPSTTSSSSSSSSSAPKAPVASRYNLNPTVGGASRYGITKPSTTTTTPITPTTSNTTSTTTSAASQPAGSK